MTKYEFSVDWFSGHIPVWERVVKSRAPMRKVLEIGSFEGRSTVWLLDNVVEGQLFCMDPWRGGLKEQDAEAMREVEARFKKNVALALAKKGRRQVNVIKANSHEGMIRLLADGHSSSFDFIYIDGDHECTNVLTDITLAFMLCRVGGLICCDDYLWSMEPPGSEDLLGQPKLAVDSFINCFRRKVKVLPGVPLYQIFLEKHQD